MARRKVRLERIENNAVRKICLKKRSAGLLKKAKELSILCGVEAFMIIYGPNDDEPMMWPSPSEIKEMLEKYESIPELERLKKKTTLTSYLMEKNEKNTEKWKKLEKNNRDMELSHLMHKLRRHGDDINCLNCSEKLRLIWLLEERMKEYGKRIDYLQLVPPLDASNGFLPLVQDQQVVPPPHFPQPLATLPPSFNGELGANTNEPNSWDRLFHEMMRNSSNVAGGSGSNNALNPPPLSQAFFGGNGGNVGARGFDRPFIGGNPFQMNMDAPNPNSLAPLPPSFDGGFQRDNVGVRGFGRPVEGGNLFQMDVDAPNPNSLAPLPPSLDGGVQRDHVGVHGFGHPFGGGNPFQMDMDAPNPNSLAPLPLSFDGGVQRDNVGVRGFGRPFEGGNPFQMDVDPPNLSSLAPLPPSFDGGVQGDAGIGAIDTRARDQWFQELLANSNNVAGGSGSNALNPTPLSQAFDFNEYGGNGDNVGAHGLGHFSEGENLFQMAMDPANPNPFGINSPNEYFGSVPSNVNSLGLESTLPTVDSGGVIDSEEGLPGLP